jgi:hypothetical protein
MNQLILLGLIFQQHSLVKKGEALPTKSVTDNGIDRGFLFPRTPQKVPHAKLYPDI